MGSESENQEATFSTALIELKWTSVALSDVARLHEFLVPVNPTAAARAVESLVTAPNKLSKQPRMGEKL